MARHSAAISDRTLAGEAMDADKLEAARLLEILIHLKSSEPPILKASKLYINSGLGGSEKAMDLHNNTIAQLSAYQSLVGCELVNILRRIMEKENLLFFPVRKPRNNRELDFLIKFSKLVLKIPQDDDDCVVSVVQTIRKGMGKGIMWEWIEWGYEYAKRKAGVAGRGVDKGIDKLLTEQASLATISYLVKLLHLTPNAATKSRSNRRKARSDDAGAGTSSSGQN